MIWLLPLAACSGGPLITDSAGEATITMAPTETMPPTPLPAGSEGVGLAFFKAWENQDYLGMYSLLTPQSQALIDAQSFAARYQEALATATVSAVNIQPISARQEGDQAEIGVRVTWTTTLVGDVMREHTAQMRFSGDRWGIVWHEGLILPELEGGFRLAMDYRVPARANIYDVDGLGLAFQGAAITLGVVPGRMEDEEALLALLSELLNRPVDDLRAIYATALPDWYVPLGDVAGDLVQENLQALAPFLDEGSLVTEERLTRLYTPDGIAPHIVGYTGPIPAENAAVYQVTGYRGDEYVGVSGLEAWGESYLRGQPGGVLWVVSSSGEYITQIQESAPRQARSIYTTLSRDFQSAVEQALAEASASHPLRPNGAVVVLDANSGAVLAMASYPDFHPRIFDAGRPTAAVELGRVLNDPGRPLINRAAQGEYPAGSVFKIVTASAGLFTGIYGPDTRYFCTGVWTGLGEDFTKYDWLEGGHGNVNLVQGLTRSCNPYFYELGLNLNLFDNDALPQVARAFGLGAATGIEGIPEASGLIPDPDWKINALGDGWAPGDTVNMAIGQGFVLVTPLQIANMLAAVGNGGTLYQPTLINRIGAGGGAPEESWPVVAVAQLPLSAEQLAIVQGSLNDVTSGVSGTAAFQMQGLRVPTAGKTGTAENAGGESHAWFAGYAPAGPYTTAGGAVLNAPEIAIAVIAENAGEGSAVAAPIFRRIVELYYGITPLTPYPWNR